MPGCMHDMAEVMGVPWVRGGGDNETGDEVVQMLTHANGGTTTQLHCRKMEVRRPYVD